jgi:hypothetical protein
VLLGGSAIKDRKQSPLGAGIDWTQPRVLPRDKPLLPRRKRRRPAAGSPAAAAEAPLRQAIATKAGGRMSPEARKRLHEARRARPWLDRLFGPR